MHVTLFCYRTSIQSVHLCFTPAPGTTEQCSHLFALFAVFDDFKKKINFSHCSWFALLEQFTRFAVRSSVVPARHPYTVEALREKRVSFCLGEYGHGYNDFVYGAFKLGTNDLDAFDACIECGACSEDKFLESDEYNDFKTGEIIGSIVGGVVGFIGLIVCLCCFCKGSWHFTIYNNSYGTFFVKTSYLVQITT